MFRNFATKVTYEMRTWTILLLLPLALSLLGGCRPSQPLVTTPPAPPCTHEGTVRDFTGLDGCGLMIVMADGRRLEPASLPDSSFTLREGQQIRFSYQSAPELMSVCMGGPLVHLTCIALR